MRYHARYKRLLDIGGALLLILLTLPALTFCICLLVLLDRPVLFRQARIGRGGRHFTIYKLRTMRDRPNDPIIRCFTLDDPRITPIGRWLRAWRLDELPQLWNVLRGDMSLVGPRPYPVAVETGWSQHQLDQRQLVRPGLTGLAMVRRLRPDADRKAIAHDLDYVERCGLRLDLVILALTIPTVIHGARRRGTATRAPELAEEVSA
jgi:lipopolysaccharide/colanic/teichoic acid biosynthesis glycosyltransferase